MAEDAAESALGNWRLNFEKPAHGNEPAFLFRHFPSTKKAETAPGKGQKRKEAQDASLVLGLLANLSS
jgi:hypothetical protein